MKRILFAVAISTFIGGVLQASSVISCSGNAAAVNSCYSSNLPAFNTRLDWAVFGTPDGTVYNGVWTTNAGGTDISIQTEGTMAGEGLRLAYNYGSMWMNNSWMMPNLVPNHPYSFAGHFGAPTADNTGYEGDSLVGLALNGSNMSIMPGLLLDTNSGLNGIAFRVASVSNSTFDLRVQLFTGLNGTGTMLQDATFGGLGGGGNCQTLYTVSSNPPTSCNDAPFVGFLNYNQPIKSILISTNDVDGFYIGALQIDAVPEPTPMILGGCGLALLFLARTKFRRS